MASQEDEKAIDGLLRRSLAGRSAVTGDCPDAELLAAYFDQSLGAEEAAGYELHFSTCARCREQLAMMARASADETATIPAHKVEELSPEPARAAARPVEGIAKAASTWTPVAQKAPAASVVITKPRSTPSKWIDLRWLVPVAAVLLVGTFTFFRFASRGTNAPARSEVAMTKSAPPPQNPAPEPEATARESAAPEESQKKAKRPAPTQPSHPTSPQPAYHPVPASNSAPAGKSAASAPSRPHPGPAGNPTSRSMRVMPGRSATLHGSYITRSQGAIIQERPSSSAEPAPPAPAPELNASLSKLPVTIDSADAVKSPAPPPPAEAEQKSQTTETNLSGFRGGAINSLGTAKAAKTRSTIPVVIKTPDFNVMYRITGGGFVEISEDGGSNWKGQRLDSSADFVAGSAPEPHVCWLVGRAGVIFLTEDGKSWQKIPSPTSGDLVDVVGRSAASATVTTKDGQKWSTDDAGKTWHTEE